MTSNIVDFFIFSLILICLIEIVLWMRVIYTNAKEAHTSLAISKRKSDKHTTLNSSVILITSGANVLLITHVIFVHLLGIFLGEPGCSWFHPKITLIPILTIISFICVYAQCADIEAKRWPRFSRYLDSFLCNYLEKKDTGG